MFVSLFTLELHSYSQDMTVVGQIYTSQREMESKQVINYSVL